MCHFLKLSMELVIFEIIFLALAAVQTPFLPRSIKFSIKATSMPNFSAVTQLLTEFHAWFQKVAHPPPPNFNTNTLSDAGYLKLQKAGILCL